jgi:FlaA1/EpsC-like NDP-sugar epimerase
MRADGLLATGGPVVRSGTGQVAADLAGLVACAVHRYRRLLVVAIHVVLIVMAHCLAFRLRFDGPIPATETLLLVQMLPWLVAVRALVFVPFRLYEGLWRYTGVWDLQNIILGVAASTVAFSSLVHGAFALDYPRSVLVIDSILLICFMGGARLARRVCREFGRWQRDKRVLIYGAGDAGEMVVRDMRHHPFNEYRPIGFVDDDPGKVGQRIHGVRVLGTRRDLPRIMAAKRPSEVLLAMPGADAGMVRAAVRALEPFKVPVKIFPDLRELLGGRPTTSQVRSLAVEDLLERAPVGLPIDPVREAFAGRQVLITGAGGSIGSELSRQIATLRPRRLVLLDRYENGLHAVATDLAAWRDGLSLHPVVADVTDGRRMAAVFAQHRPDIIFHAAAHKHLPLMEVNPCEAVKNNVRGTRLLATLAARHGTERFILISSDKAVNPSSVMGATKRAAELIVESMTGRTFTCFVAVRFGNVLGSNGSVVPHFLDQIEAGGPVTVTHPEMRRYFMLVSEAVQLVLHAATLAKGGEIFALDMGEQLKVLDLARTLIRRSGFVPDEDISIRFIGLRPGEKLSEELVGSDETLEASAVAKILRVRPRWVPDAKALAQQLADLERLAAENDAEGVINRLRETVPTFVPLPNNAADSLRPRTRPDPATVE